MWPPARPQVATDPRTNLSPPSKKRAMRPSRSKTVRCTFSSARGTTSCAAVSNSPGPTRVPPGSASFTAGNPAAARASPRACSCPWTNWLRSQMKPSGNACARRCATACGRFPWPNSASNRCRFPTTSAAWNCSKSSGTGSVFRFRAGLMPEDSPASRPCSTTASNRPRTEPSSTAKTSRAIGRRR